MVKLIALIRPAETKTFTAEGESAEEAKNNAEAMVPDGWELTSVKTHKD